MKTQMRRSVSIILVLTMFFTILMPAYAEKSEPIGKDDFVHKLGANVNAHWQSSHKTLMIYGDGKIENTKWQALAQLFDPANFTRGGAWVKNDDFTIIFADKTVRFPDETMIEQYGFFEDFDGEIRFAENMDTSNVKDMSRMFSGTAKADPNVAAWNTSNVEKMTAMFAQSYAADPDVSRWDVSRVQDLSQMFYNAKKAKPNVSEWQPVRLQKMQAMFSGASKMVEIDLSKWDRLKDISASGAFLNLPNLKYLTFQGLVFREGEIGLNDFAGPYIVERLDGGAKIETIENPTQGYSFVSNVPYRVSMLCMVRFDSDGGSEVAPARVVYGKKVAEPKTPTRLGYRFVRWELGGVKFDFDTLIKDNILLKAVWTSDGTILPPPPEDMVEIKAVLRVGSDILEKSVNGKKTEIMMDAKPFIEKGRIMLPLRYVAEALEMGVGWDHQAKIVILKDKKNEVVIPTNSLQVIVNGKIYYSDVKPVILYGRTFLSLSNIAKPLGLEHGKTILWDNDTKTATFIRSIEK